MPGYDPNRFVGLNESEKQEYTCGICLDIFGDPVDTKCCGQTFCRPCIEGALRVNSVCPLDRRPLNIGDLQNTSSATRLTCLEPNIEQDTLLPITVVSAKSHYRLMSLENKRSLYKCGNGYKTLADIPSWNLYSQHNGIIHNRFVTSAFPYNYIINDKVSVFVGDITALEVDAIVNSANEYLRGGGGGL
ncbi:unnamed protein product [Oppiella nova]|uniref:RING-type domain-containing protein n=1 Tax=Oppiella nova TaxID=334625 RepID=A0A7R9MBY0_9ACAR|nr:unnamed protein product [Oppiella nova]CAG2174559.1 unnamed protein product [Oppiella nova]